jgi:hypothetical protein
MKECIACGESDERTEDHLFCEQCSLPVIPADSEEWEWQRNEKPWL